MKIEDITDRSIIVKIKYDNPGLISMSDQSIQDRLVIKLSRPLYGKNGLVMKTDGFDSDENGQIQTTRSIQPMIDTEAPAI